MKNNIFLLVLTILFEMGGSHFEWIESDSSTRCLLLSRHDAVGGTSGKVGESVGHMSENRKNCVNISELASKRYQNYHEKRNVRNIGHLTLISSETVLLLFLWQD